RRPEPQYDVIHGAVGLPLKIGAAVVGIMTLGATELARQFTAEEVELLEQFARLAALAIDNARLFDETQQAKQAADTLRAAYLDLSQSLELDLICEKLLDWLKKFTPYDSATIFLLEGDTRLVARAVRGYEAWGVLDQARTAAFEIESASGVAAVITGQKSRLIPDVTQDPRWIGVASAAHVRAWLGVPMMSGGKVIGVCSLDSAQTNFFEPEHVQLAESLAIQAAFAIQNAASYDEARQARKVAEAANRAKSIFLAKMSHELRTPLNGILGYAQILKRNPDLRPAQRDGLNLIYQSGQHLLTLINDVLDLAKVEAGKVELSPNAINLARFLENVTGIIRMRAQQKGIRFIYDPDDDLPAGIFADETRLRQVLINLLGNAVKFTEQGSVTLRVEILDNSISDIGYSMLDNQSSIPNAQSASGGAGSTKYPITNIQFTVEDTGPGIPADQMNTIFQPFEQIGATEYRAEGTGLGLSISRQLVQAMGSELQVESQVGQGSRFWFEAQFPIVAASEQEEAAAPEISGYHGARKRILVVDDKSENRLVLLGMLTPLGFEVDLATDGEAALVSVREFQPDLILMDLVMPGMSGFEAVEQIRQMPAAAARQTPIVAVSASVLDMDQARSQQIGCDAFLPKPIVTGELLALIGDLLSLEWVLESSAAALSVDEAEMTVVATALLPPPGEQLEVLHELALYGSMERIQQQADQIEALDPKYGPFARQLRKLAAEFEDEKILALVEQFREENDQPG
ncbi:MAG: ATP-binding protein, partial [Methyloligellaceae bacterium]